MKVETFYITVILSGTCRQIEEEDLQNICGVYSCTGVTETLQLGVFD